MTDRDQDILALFQSDRPKGLRSLMEQYHVFLVRLAYRMLGDEQAACDATQQTYIRLFFKKWRFDERSSLKTYLASIAINACRDALRKQKRRERLMDAWAREAEPNQSPAPAVTSRQQMVRRALCRLPLNFRIPLQLCEWEGMTYEEIAQALKIPLNTVRSRIARGRARLSELIRAAGDTQ